MATGIELITKESSADKALEEACAKCPISRRCFVEDKGRKDACDYLRGVNYGIACEKEQMEKKISLIQKSWYEQGKIDGKCEGLTDDEKYQQGVFDEHEKIMKRAFEVEKDNVAAITQEFFRRVQSGEKVKLIILK